MKTLIANLNRQIVRLEQKVNELNATTKIALHNKSRISALSALRSKKLTENTLKQRSDTLNQLQEVYNKIEQAADQVEIVRVMEASAGVLRGLHAQTGGVERVEDVVEELREEMSKVEEIGNIVSETGPVIDEGEIDDELEALESQERRREEEEEAEVTRQRLALLDNTEHAAKEAERKLSELSNNTEMTDDSLLAESIGKLSNMSLEDHAQGEDLNHRQEPEKQKQSLPAL
jgi:charged multivesicular body protein 7